MSVEPIRRSPHHAVSIRDGQCLRVRQSGTDQRGRTEHPKPAENEPRQRQPHGRTPVRAATRLRMITRTERASRGRSPDREPLPRAGATPDTDLRPLQSGVEAFCVHDAPFTDCLQLGQRLAGHRKPRHPRELLAQGVAMPLGASPARKVILDAWSTHAGDGSCEGPAVSVQHQRTDPRFTDC